MMGEHLCGPAVKATEPTPPPAGGGYLGGALASVTNAFGFGSRAPPPTVDTAAANQAFTKPDQLTPVSTSTGSRTFSPKTPTGRSGTGPNGDDYFTPAIAADSPSQGGRAGGYGGFGDSQQYEAESVYSSSPNKQLSNPPSLLQRMNSIAPGPFEMNRRPGAKNAFASRNDRANTLEDDMGYSSSNGNVARPRAPRKNGYGGFGAPRRDGEDDEEEPEPRPLGSNQRAGTFPRETRNKYDGPTRTPSAPGSRLSDRGKRRTNDYDEYNERPVMTQDGQPGLSFGMRDTSRPPPPHKNLGQALPTGQNGSVTVNLADEFGAANPYHSPSVSQSSSNSGYSDMSRPSQPSSNTSPARSMSSRRQPSDTSNIDTLMDDLQSSMSRMSSEAKPNASRKPPPVEKDDAVTSNNVRGRPQDSGFNTSVQDGRAPPSATVSDQAAQGQARPRRRPPPPDILQFNRGALAPADRAPRQRSPLAAPSEFNSFSSRNDAPPQTQPDRQPRYPTASEDRYSSSSGSGRRDPSVQRDAAPSRTHGRQPSMGRSRGNCKACGELITGKSISSADGRLTGRYHKACFVCTTCSEPFSSSTFYVLNDQPYCERHYHKLNGSLCGMCNNGIEGQYLEDESMQKYHVGCFRCGDCGEVLREGYFEVNGKAFCERDAWKRVIQPPAAQPRGYGVPKSGRQPGGYPGDRRLAPPNARPRMEKRMTRLGMM